MTDVYEESGLIIDLSDFPHFRFSYGYQDPRRTYHDDKLNGYGIKETDFTFLYQNKVHLLEVKRYAYHSPEESRLKSEQRQCLDFEPGSDDFKEWLEKLRDGILLMLAIWLGTPDGLKLREEMDPVFHHPKPLVVLIAIQLPDHLKEQMSYLRETFMKFLTKKTRDNLIRLLDIRYVLLDYDLLMSRYPQIPMSLKDPLSHG